MVDKYALCSMPLDLTARMRRAVIEKFNPNTPSPDRQIWDLWYMPETYCYLITEAHNVLSAELLDAFRKERDSQFKALGLTDIELAFGEQIHVYVNGMFQNLHNDAGTNGYSYVHYLQDEVHFTGGQTLLYTKPFPDFEKPAAGFAFYEQIEPVCGRMVLFDNRVPHQVPVVQGTMNPARGRITLCSRIRTKSATLQTPRLQVAFKQEDKLQKGGPT